MTNSNLKKNMLIGICGYIFYLITMSIVCKPLDYNFNNCTDLVNNTDINLCECETIVDKINLANIVTILYGVINSLILLIIFNIFVNVNHSMNICIILTILYFFIILIVGLPVFFKLILDECLHIIVDFNSQYVFAYIINQFLTLIFIGLVIVIEKTYLKKIIDCSIFVKTGKIDSNSNSDEERLQETPPPYYE
jgi:hypothetical protein